VSLDWTGSSPAWRRPVAQSPVSVAFSASLCNGLRCRIAGDRKVSVLIQQDVRSMEEMEQETEKKK
jgi:hypothetical protein